MENDSNPHKHTGPIEIGKTPRSDRRIPTFVHRITILELKVESELRRVRQAYISYQAQRRRNAVFDYLTAVFDIVARWNREQRLQQSLQQARKMPSHVVRTSTSDAYTNVIAFTSDPQKTDSKARSKWARALRWAEATKSKGETLAEFVQRNGGINECAASAKFKK